LRKAICSKIGVKPKTTAINIWVLENNFRQEHKYSPDNRTRQGGFR
jgi:hypothetical protein